MAKEVKNKNNKHFLKDFKAELKKVIWPTPKQLINSTTAVITIVLITAVIVFVLDLAFETVNKHGVNKLKSIVSNTTVEDNTVTDETENNTVTNNATQEGNTVQNEDSNTTQNTVQSSEDTNQVQE